MSELQTFLKKYGTKLYSRGNVIIQQDMMPECVYIIKKGTIKTYNLTAGGEERPIGFNVAGSLFPIGWVFDKISQTQYYYEALTSCRLYAVPKDELLDFLSTHPAASREIMDRCAWEMIIHQMRIHALTQSKATDKIIHTIHYLSLCFGRDLRPDMVEIPLPITQQDLANLTGLTRETVSSELKKLAQAKVIFYRTRNFVVLTDKLNQILDDEYEHRLIRKL